LDPATIHGQGLLLKGETNMREKDPQRIRKAFDSLYQIETLTKIVTDTMYKPLLVRGNNTWRPKSRTGG